MPLTHLSTRLTTCISPWAQPIRWFTEGLSRLPTFTPFSWALAVGLEVSTCPSRIRLCLTHGRCTQNPITLEVKRS